MLYQKRRPGRLLDTLFDHDHGRCHGSLCALSLLALLLITPLAYACACDSTWIPGLYDVAGFDDVALFLIETAAATVPGPGALAVCAPAMCGVVCPSVHIQGQPPRAGVSRGPPRIELRSVRFCASHAFAAQLVSISFPVAAEPVLRLTSLTDLARAKRVLT